MTEDVAALDSQASVVVITAPAGFGKTTQAAKLAQLWAQHLESPRQVLVLAHTNSAVEEFRRRTQNAAARVHATTFDGFAAELLRPYAGPLGLPVPLQRYLGEPEGPKFSELAPTAERLLTQTPTLVQILAHKYPLVILDEHQDSTQAQHAVAKAIADKGMLRIFGDPMQAIYDAAEGTAQVDWHVLEASADEVVTLDTPHRWTDAPELGAWLRGARDALEAGESIPLDNLPESVTVDTRPEMECAGFGAGDPRQLSPIVHNFLRFTANRSVAVLSHRRKLAERLPGISGGRLPINEGSDYEPAFAAARTLANSLGDAPSCARVLLKLVQQSSKGLNQARHSNLERRFHIEGVDLRRAKQNECLLKAFKPLWHRPDLEGVATTAVCLLEASYPDWMELRKPQSLHVLARMRVGTGIDIRDAVAGAVKAHKLRAAKPWRCASTVHKAKGLEFDDVLLINASAQHFPDTEYGRKLAYVALTRATHRLCVVVPGMAPSPLFTTNS